MIWFSSFRILDDAKWIYIYNQALSPRGNYTVTSPLLIELIQLEIRKPLIKIDDNAEALDRKLLEPVSTFRDTSMILSHQYQNSGAIKRRVIPKMFSWCRDLRFLHFDTWFWNAGMDENIINLIFNPLFLLIAVKLALPRLSNQKETACHYKNWYFGVHSFFRCHLDIYPWSLFQSDSLFFLCFLIRNLVAIWSAVDTAGWDSSMKNWSRGVRHIQVHHAR